MAESTGRRRNVGARRGESRGGPREAAEGARGSAGRRARMRGVRASPDTLGIVMMGQGSLTGGFLENLKITGKLGFLRFFGPCGNYGKITENLRKTTEIKQELMNKYKFLQFPSIFRNFLLFFADFENSEFGKCILILR